MTQFEIIIPTINRADLLLEGIEGLKNSGVWKKASQVHIIDNGDQRELDFLEGEINLYRPRKNLGVAGSWNWGMLHLYPESIGAFILNDDIVWEPSLEELEEFLEKPQKVAKSSNHWCVFWMSKKVFGEVGLFDEGFFPAYYEDNDWTWRAKNLNIKITNHPLLTPKVFRNSQTIAKDGKLNKGFAELKERYKRKWGGEPGEEKWTLPWNSGGLEDWSISESLFSRMKEVIPIGERLLEFGSGDGTPLLNAHWRVLSIEHDREWAQKMEGKFQYRVKPITFIRGHKTYKLLSDDLQKIKKFPYILIDGPPSDRRGVIHYNGIFNKAKVIIVDDTHRANERELMERIKGEYEVRDIEEIKTHNKKAHILYL